MKKAGMKLRLDDDQTVLLVIFIIVVGFILGMKPIYQTVAKLKNGTLFHNTDVDKKPVVKPEEPEEVYKILKPKGASNVMCKKVYSEDTGDKTVKTYIYYTNGEVKSIKEDISFSSITEEYSNYMLAEQNKFKQRKSNNLDNNGYSVDINFESTSSLKISSVYLLEKTDLADIKLAKKDDRLETMGQLNQNVYNLADEYTAVGYECEW